MTDSVIGFIVGAMIGFILGYIVATLRETKQEMDEVLRIERTRDDVGILNNRAAVNITYAIMLAFVFYAAVASFQTNRQLDQNIKDTFVRTCQAGSESRDVQRQITDAVYTLAVGVVQREKGDPPLSEEQKESINAYLERANTFRHSTYEKIKPSDQCLPYVEDDQIFPPTPDQPLLE